MTSGSPRGRTVSSPAERYGVIDEDMLPRGFHVRRNFERNHIFTLRFPLGSINGPRAVEAGEAGDDSCRGCSSPSPGRWPCGSWSGEGLGPGRVLQGTQFNPSDQLWSHPEEISLGEQ